MGNALHLLFQPSKHLAIKQYQYEDLRKATNNFSIARLVASGAYSSIFLGTYKEMKFAVRRLDHVSLDPMDYNAKLPVCNVLADFCSMSPYPLAFLDPCYLVGHACYSAPELHFYGILSRKSDVYSFGVVLLELLTRCKAKDIPRNAQTNLVSWAKLNLDRPDKIIPLLDDGIKNEYPSFGPILVAYIAKWCIKDEPFSRPSMMNIVLLLEKVLSLSQMSRR